MSFLTLPDAADVVAKTQLRPELVDRDLADDAALVAEALTRIEHQADCVETKLLGVITQAAWEAQEAGTLARRDGMATEVIHLRAQASLFGTSGHLRPAYHQKATEKREEAKELLDDLVNDITNAGAAPASGTGATSFSTAPYRIDENGVLVDNA